MDFWSFLKELVMLAGGAFLLGALARRLGQSPIVGYLLCGAVVGPLLFNAAAVRNAAELGVALLLQDIAIVPLLVMISFFTPAAVGISLGMLLGESPFATQIRADIGALRTIMVALFFASVGMLLKPLWLLQNLHWVLLAALAVFILKTVLIFGIGRLFRLDNRQALATGITLGQVGEFSFVLTAANEEVLLHAGLSGVCLAVVTLPDPLSTIRVVQMLRSLKSELTIAARSRYNYCFNDIEKAGADIIIDEESVVGRQLARKIVDHLQTNSDRALACRLAGQPPEIVV